MQSVGHIYGPSFPLEQEVHALSRASYPPPLLTSRGSPIHIKHDEKAFLCLCDGMHIAETTGRSNITRSTDLTTGEQEDVLIRKSYQWGVW
jgi:hypothetical protein